MAIQLADLIIFNNVESTDLIQGVTQLPYYKASPYQRNRTFVSGYDSLVEGQNGRGTQVVIRQLGKGAAVNVKANTAGAFRYTHAETPDRIITIPIDDVIKQSEEIFEAVEQARVSATGARKAEIVLSNTVEISQDLISQGLVTAALDAADTTAVTSANIKDIVIDLMGELSYVPNIFMVTKKTYGELLKLVTTGEFVASFDTIHTGFLGHFLGMEVWLDESLPATVDFVLYNYLHWNVFNMLQFFTFVEATDFDGTYVRSLMLQGVYGATTDAEGNPLDATNGAWAIVKKNA